MRKLISILIFVISVNLAFGQVETVEVTGVGFGDDQAKARQDAIDDALRLAVGQAMGVHVKSETQVSNYVTLSDAISTRSDGYIKKYDILKENAAERNKYEVTIKAEVSTEVMIEDAKTLADLIGGVRFIVIYDGRNLTEKENDEYQFAYERMNEKLNDEGYPRTEAGLFNKVIKHINEDSEIGYLNAVGLYTNSEFIIQIKNIEITTEQKAGGLVASQVVMDIKAYDNCNWRNLGAVVFKSDWKVHKDPKMAARNAMADAIDLYFDRLMLQFNKDIGRWATKGAPYELRFYTEMRFKHFSLLKNKLKENPSYGGKMEMLSAGGYKKIVIDFKKKQDELMDLVMEAIYEIPELGNLDLEPKIIYGRQISLVPYEKKAEEIEQKLKILKLLGRQ